MQAQLRRRLVASRPIIGLLALALLIGLLVYFNMTGDQADRPASESPKPGVRQQGKVRPPDVGQEVPGPPTRDEQYRQLVVGTWEDEYKGKRTLTIREDGTATMVVELAGLTAALYAPRLQFEMSWSIKDGHLKKQTTGGEPAEKVKLILKMMGDRVNEQILELTEDRLLLLDEDGKTKYDWRRVQ